MSIKGKIAVIIIFGFISFFLYRVLQNYSVFRLEDSEGICTHDSQCIWAGRNTCDPDEGRCTSLLADYKFTSTQCKISKDFLYHDYFACGCVTSINRCGWKISLGTKSGITIREILHNLGVYSKFKFE